MTRITAHHEVNRSMSETTMKEAHASRDQTDDNMRNVGFLYDQDLTDGFGAEVNERIGQTTRHANEIFGQQKEVSKRITDADYDLMDAKDRARNLFR